MRSNRSISNSSNSSNSSSNRNNNSSSISSNDTNDSSNSGNNDLFTISYLNLIYFKIRILTLLDYNLLQFTMIVVIVVMIEFTRP